MNTFVVLFLSCVSVLGAETLIPLKSGETIPVSYGLSCLVSDARSASDAAAGQNLVLTLRNDGEKMMDTDSITVEDFSLRDAKGQEMTIYLCSKPDSMGYGEATIIHLRVVNAGKAPQPWTLRLKSHPKAHPFELTITDIKPRKR